MDSPIAGPLTTLLLLMEIGGYVIQWGYKTTPGCISCQANGGVATRRDFRTGRD